MLSSHTITNILFHTFDKKNKTKEAYCKPTNKKQTNQKWNIPSVVLVLTGRHSVWPSRFDKHPNISWGFAVSFFFLFFLVSLSSVWVAQTWSWWFKRKIFSAKYLCHIYIFLWWGMSWMESLRDHISTLLWTEHTSSAYDDLTFSIKS